MYVYIYIYIYCIRIVFSVVTTAILLLIWFLLCWSPVFGKTAKDYILLWFGW